MVEPDYVTSSQFAAAMNSVDARLDSVETRCQELDKKIDRVAAELLAAMPNKDDYVTRAEFNEFREQFNRLQAVVLRMDETIQVELVVRNREMERLNQQSDKHDQMLKLHQRAIEVVMQLESRAATQLL